MVRIRRVNQQCSSRFLARAHINSILFLIAEKHRKNTQMIERKDLHHTNRIRLLLKMTVTKQHKNALTPRQ